MQLEPELQVRANYFFMNEYSSCRAIVPSDCLQQKRSD
jgi:hypothetical protein